MAGLFRKIQDGVKNTKDYYDMDALLRREKAVAEKEQAIANLENAISEKDTQLAQREEYIRKAIGDIYEREKSLIRREKTLKKKQEELEEKERNIEKVIDCRVDQKDRAQLEQLRFMLDNMEQYRQALDRTETRVLGWVERREKEDIEIFDELSSSVEKFKTYSQKHPMNGYDFEAYVAGILKNAGFSNVQVTKKSGDFGGDVTAVKDETSYVIQCKFYSSPVGIEAVTQALGAKEYYKAHVAAVATNSVFTKAAQILADEARVVLWDGEYLEKLKS